MIAVDWGTSSLRAYLLGPAGEIVARRESPSGILAVRDGHFAETLLGHISPWIEAGDRTILMSGMIGSRQGWKEAPYVRAPAGAAEIASALVAVEVASGLQAWLVPGVMAVTPEGVPDVMRGEETQILGATHVLGTGSHLLCLTGTHSKWVSVEDGSITGFRTSMTGEVFAVLREHSILGRTMSPGNGFDATTFEAGLRRAGDPGGLLHHLFGVRARHLAGELADDVSGDYLSGILIGHELGSAKGERTIHILGAHALAQRYVHACRVLGRDCSLLDADAAATGLWHLVRSRPGL
ncbi:MAG: 2-dehydro-3-deoxygalactonokinase [Betaproteobacteria bacterium]